MEKFFILECDRAFAPIVHRSNDCALENVVHGKHRKPFL